MIIVYLQGGMGNQMFQYAAGRRIASLHDVPLKLDLSRLDSETSGVTPRSYALGPFSINAELATEQETARLYQPQPGRMGRFINSIKGRQRQTHIRENGFRFDPALLQLSGDISLDGYWQSEKYFSDIASEIRRDLTLRLEPEGRNGEAADLINGSASISIHIRRGDFVDDAKVAVKHGACSSGYYMKAVEMIAERVERPHFFVFSDDPDWVRENFTIPHAMTVVGHNGPGQAHEDLRLMSMCRHHVIANSSFSWWGAWLNPRADKVVLAPSRWFNDASMDTRDLLPASWLRIAP